MTTAFASANSQNVAAPAGADGQKSTLTVWEIDPGHAQVEFAVRHLMIATVRGRFSDVAGTILFDQERPERSSVRVTIGSASVDTRNDGRDEHLRSADFLDAANYPVLTFESTKVTPRGRGSALITGDLTIRGTTRQATLDAEFHGIVNDPWGDTKASFSATTTVNRKDYGLTWNLALESGGVLVGDDVKITIEFQAVKQAAGTEGEAR